MIFLPQSLSIDISKLVLTEGDHLSSDTVFENEAMKATSVCEFVRFAISYMRFSVLTEAGISFTGSGTTLTMRRFLKYSARSSVN